MRGFLRLWYPAALVVASVAISLLVYARLPEQMAVHWNMEGTPNGWMSRRVGAFFTPGMLVVLWGILRSLPAIEPRRENFASFSGAYDVTVAAVLSLLFATHLIVLALALGHRLPVARIVPVLAGALCLVIGNVLPIARSNFMFGVRTPWTLSSERVWARTHRLAGFTMTAAGIVMIVTGVFLPTDLSLPVILAATVAATIGPVVYSYLTWRREVK